MLFVSQVLSSWSTEAQETHYFNCSFVDLFYDSGHLPTENVVLRSELNGQFSRRGNSGKVPRREDFLGIFNWEQHDVNVSVDWSLESRYTELQRYLFDVT